MKKKILFITPSLARTGSEMVLWYLLRNIDRSKFEPYLFCLRKGELFDELSSDIRKEISYKGSKVWYKKLIRGLLKAIGIEPIAHQLKQIQKRFHADVWYVNTILIPQAHPMAKSLNIKIATHIHELLFAFSFIREKEMKNIINYSDTIIGCSELVSEKISALGHHKVEVQNSFIEEKSIICSPERINLLRGELNIKESDFVWVVSGTLAYMKGLDYVLQLAEIFKDKPVKILWLGEAQDNGLNYYVKEIASRYNGTLIFLGSAAEDYYNYLSLANGFLLLSKEESFSLVMLEAAYLQIPIVAFDSGMAKKFIKTGMGKVVESWNIEDMAHTMEDVREDMVVDRDLLRIEAMKYTVKNQIRKFEALLDEL